MKKSEVNIEDLRNQTVSWGTHRPDDLIPKFMAVLKEYGKEAYDKYVSENPEVEDWKTLDDETKGWVVDELFDLLDGIAPEDCYFGAHPGDGADFGFWQVDESKRKDSKKSEAEGNKDIFTLDLTRIDAEGDEEGLDDMQAAQNFYDEDEAIQAAKDLADSYRDDDDVVQVTVMAGEQEKPNGDIVGEPFDIFTASSSDSATTAKYREKANYTKTDGLDYYAKGGKSEAKKSEAYNWIAFYFCKDKRTGTEYAVIPQDRVFVVGNGGGRYNLSYLDANGHWDRLSYGYFATSCEPISDPENSKVYAVVKADEDRRIIALTESEFDTIVEADDAVKTVKSIVANNYESKKSEDFDMNKVFFQAKKAITDWTKRQGHKTLEWLYTDGRKSPTSYPSGIWDFEWDTGNGMATAELKVSPYETRTNSWNDSMDFSLRVGTEDKPTFYTSVEDVLSALDTLISETEESKKSEGGDDKDCKGKDCKDDITNKNEADATFKVGDFVTYDAASDGKEDFINQYVSAEIAEINDDGSLVLWIYDLDDGGNDVNDADPQFCTKLDHYAGKVDADHYYMDGPYKAYKGGWEILITKKDLNPRVYEFIGTMDDLGEVLDVDAYYGGENFVFDEDLKDEVANNTVWDVETTTFADMTGDVGESKQTEGLPPKKLGNRLYRSRADLINKMKTLDAVEITTPAQFNDIHSKQWLHTAGYAMDINGNLVGQTYFGDKDGKWYYATTKTFQGDYLPECKEEAKKSKSRFGKMVEGNATDYDGKYYVDIEDEDEDALYSSDIEFDSSRKASLWAFDELEKCKDNDDVFQASVYQLFINDDGDLDHELVEVIHKSDVCESKKSESLTLKQKELKNMARYGEATDITTISDAEAKELKKKGIETVGISRGAYGMNGALLRDNEGNKYVITARSSNLFYFV